MRRLALALLLAGAAALPTGCLFATQRGIPVFVEARLGDFWSGEGELIEYSPDGARCRVVIRMRSAFVERRWFPCKYVHERPDRHP